MTNFGVHSPCESRDITFLICHVTTWGNMTVGGVPSSYITTLLGLVSIGLMELEIMAYYYGVIM